MTTRSEVDRREMGCSPNTSDTSHTHTGGCHLHMSVFFTPPPSRGLWALNFAKAAAADPKKDRAGDETELVCVGYARSWQAALPKR